ncbi:MAG: PA2779 family protein [Acidobacteriaceae bacterium]
MKKLSAVKVPGTAALLLSFALLAPQQMVAQTHVVPPAQIQKDLSISSATRQQNEKQLKGFLSMPEMQRAMKEKGINPQQVTNAVSQLNNADLARLAQRSQTAQRDFAGGAIGLGIFTLIGIVVVVLILVAVFA